MTRLIVLRPLSVLTVFLPHRLALLLLDAVAPKGEPVEFTSSTGKRVTL